MSDKLPSRVFKGFNTKGKPCPFCKTRADTDTVLVPIPGTEEDGNMQASQVHLTSALLIPSNGV